MQKKHISLIILALVLVSGIILSGCTKKASEKAAETVTEKAIEKSTNGQADVDISTNTVTINTNGSSFQAGENVSLPSGFPSDIYVIDGTLKSATTTNENNGYSLSIETSKSLSNARDQYEQKLKDEGWTVTATMNFQGSASIVAEKDNRSVSVMVSESDGKTTVVVITSEKSN